MRDCWNPREISWGWRDEREVGHPWLSIISSLEFGREREHEKKKCGVKKKETENKKFARETPWVISSRRFTPRARKK